MGPTIAFRRMLGEIEYLFEPGRIHEIIEENGADPNGKFTRRDGLISKDTCDVVKSYMDDIHENDETLDPYEIHMSNLPRHAHYNILITASKFVELVGLDAVKNILAFYHEALGYDAPVTKIKLQMSWNMNRQEHFTYHIDRKSSMIIFLGPNEDAMPFEGGGLAYLNQDGLQIEPMVPGSGIVHGPIVLHGAEGWIGKRYIIDILSYPDVDGCILQDYLDKVESNDGGVGL